MSIIPKFLDEALTPIAKESGERLADIVSLVFTPIIKAKAIRDKNLEKFLKELEKEVNKIPENNIKEPPLNIVGTALEEVLKYHCDEEYMRKMFSKLIASSMSKNSVVHPSYVEIIKQLSRYDIQVLRNFFVLIKINSPEVYYEFSYFMLEIYYQKGIFGWTSSNLMFAKNNEEYNIIKNARKFISSLENLERLALIKIRDNGINPSIKMSDFNFVCSLDDIIKIGKIEVMGTVYLEDLINACFTKELYDSLDGNIIFE